jgi:FkbM family methyltransferase
MSSVDLRPRAPKMRADSAEKMYPELYRAVKHLLKDDFFVLNIGANDGVDNDPIHPFLMMFPHWRGICVEPVHYNFKQLTYNYRNFPAIKLVQAAIGDQKKPLYYIDERSGCDMNYVSQCCSFDREYVLNTLASLRKIGPGIVSDDAESYLITDNSIPCLSLDQLLQDWNVEQVDFLNIDVEGHDYEVFKGFNFARFKPAIVCVESAGFNDAQSAIFKQTMSDNNYHFLGIFGLFSEMYARGTGESGEIVPNSLPIHLTPMDTTRDSAQEYAMGSTIEFGELGEARKILDYGWGPQREGHCWSKADKAALTLRIPSEYVNVGLELILEYRTFLDQDKLASQRIGVSVNGVVVHEWIEDRRTARKSITIPAECVGQTDLTIQFDLPDAASPKALELGHDARKLGIAMHSIRLVQL